MEYPPEIAAKYYLEKQLKIEKQLKDTAHTKSEWVVETVEMNKYSPTPFQLGFFDVVNVFAGIPNRFTLVLVVES